MQKKRRSRDKVNGTISQAVYVADCAESLARCERRISLAYGYASRQGETRNEYSEVISL